MSLITDINDEGISSFNILTLGGLMQVTIGGEWAGASVELQRKVGDTYLTVKSYSENAFDIVESAGSGLYRFKTTGSPTIICDVSFDAGGGRVES